MSVEKQLVLHQLCYMRHFSIQSEVKPKPIVTHLYTSRLCQLHECAIILSSDWFTGLSVPFVIGQSDYFGFGLTILT